MRRVVVTGLGIVSCIGNDAKEVAASLKAGKSGITRDEKQTELGFKSCISGRPTLNPKDFIDKRSYRFMGEGAGWTAVAMQQAIDDAGLTDEQVSHERTGIIGAKGDVLNSFRDARDPFQNPRRELFHYLGLHNIAALYWRSG